MDSKKKRQYSRHPSNIPVTVTSYNDKTVSDVQSLNNISLGGASFESEQQWEKGMVVNISFHPPYDFSRELLRITGKVVWCRQKGHYFDVGIEFTQPTGGAINITSFVEEMYYEINVNRPFA